MARKFWTERFGLIFFLSFFQQEISQANERLQQEVDDKVPHAFYI